jgi:hypothetical protein
LSETPSKHLFPSGILPSLLQINPKLSKVSSHTTVQITTQYKAMSSISTSLVHSLLTGILQIDGSCDPVFQIIHDQIEYLDVFILLFIQEYLAIIVFLLTLRRIFVVNPVHPLHVYGVVFF